MEEEKNREMQWYVADSRGRCDAKTITKSPFKK